MSNSSMLWHKGEIAIQQRAGVAEQMAVRGPQVVRDHLLQQHRDFFAALPNLLLGRVDAAGHPWASMLEGQPGFARSPDPGLLHIAALPAHDDPVGMIRADEAVALLGIELHSRRRNRLNGHVRDAGPAGFDVAVEHSYGNCPKYIQLREYRFVRDPALRMPAVTERRDGLDAPARELIRAADTFFVASYADLDDDPARRQVDVSHRGGKRGFVDVDGDWLTIPDFPGNRYFNTLGNLLVNPRAGLLFIDFESGELVQLSGSTLILFDGPEVAAFEGAERLWRVRVEQMVRRRDALALRWRFGEYSPNSLLTGSWEAARARLAHTP